MIGDGRNSPRKSSANTFHKRKGGDSRDSQRKRHVRMSVEAGMAGRHKKSSSRSGGIEVDLPRPEISDDGQITEGKYLASQVVHSRIMDTVPMPKEDRIELFRILGKKVRAARFLDLCAGTGMIGIEAISRGALLGSFVERKARRCSQIRENLKAVGVNGSHGEVFEEETEGFLKRMSEKRRFWDIAFYDPPYDADYGSALSVVGSGTIVRPRGIFVIRHHPEMFFAENLGVLKRRSLVGIGNDSLSFYDRKA